MNPGKREAEDPDPFNFDISDDDDESNKTVNEKMKVSRNRDKLLSCLTFIHLYLTYNLGKTKETSIEEVR